MRAIDPLSVDGVSQLVLGSSITHTNTEHCSYCTKLELTQFTDEVEQVVTVCGTGVH